MSQAPKPDPDAAMPAARHGEVVAERYRLLDTIAVGGSGTVYRARDDNDRLVAIKVMHAEHPEGDAERRRFEREAEIIQRLVHPHVVRVLGFGHTADGMPFLVFPLLEGQTLDSKLKITGGLPVPEVGRLSLQLLSALDKAHAAGIAHRDIKPANIFLVPSALGDNVQILDFGLAKLVFHADSAEVTRTGALVGTPRYMAPEQVRGEQVSETADIYSLGLVMAEMLLGRPVVSAARELDIYMTHGSDKPLELPAEVTRSPFAALIRRAVAKPLEVRYHQASQMHADLRAVLELMNAGRADLASVDMEATFITNPDQVRPLSLPTETSEKLRDAFNKLAGSEADVPEAAPTLIHAATPRAPVSMPILLTKAPLDEVDTLRMNADAVRAELAAARQAAPTEPAVVDPPAAAAPAAPPATSPALSEEMLAAIAEADVKAAQSAQRSSRIALIVATLVFVLFAALVYFGAR